MDGFGVNIIYFSVENIYLKLEVIGDIWEIMKKVIQKAHQVVCNLLNFFTSFNRNNFNGFQNFIVTHQ